VVFFAGVQPKETGLPSGRKYAIQHQLHEIYDTDVGK